MARKIFGLAKLLRKFKKIGYDSAEYKSFAVKIQLITKNFG